MALARPIYATGSCAQYRIEELKIWRSMDYEDFDQALSTSGEAWEEFNSNFRMLRARASEDGRELSVADLHRGAIIEPEILKSVEVGWIIMGTAAVI